MKIGLVNGNPGWGGGEQWFLDAAKDLSARGHDLLLAAAAGTALHRSFGGMGQDACDLEGLKEGLAKGFPGVVLVNSPGDLRRVVRACGRRPPFRLCLRRGIDRPLRDNLFRRPYWRSLSAILVNSDATGRTVQRSLPWFPPTRIRRIYNPVSFSPAERADRADDLYRFGAAGRLVRQKGFGVLVSAFARVAARRACSLEIAGEGRQRGRLERRIKRLGLEERCTLLGHLDDLAPFYARLDAVVMPSLYEGFGFVAAEAALAGLPVVASEVSSLPEIVLHEDTGLLVPPGDAEALARAMEDLAEREDRGRSLGEAGRKRALDRFDPKGLHEELEAFLRTAMDLPPVGERR